jgi:beta-N-acetylhexosaminidase
MPHSQYQSVLSRRSFLRRVGGVATATLLASAATAAPVSSQGPRQSLPPDVNPPPLPASFGPTWPASDVSLGDKIGQMIMVGFGGTNVTATSRIVEHIRQRNLGGVALFGPNVETYEQVRSLVQQLQAAAATPLLIATDQEGGYVRRLGSQFGLTLNYTPQQLGAMDDLDVTRQFAAEMAQLLVDLGINLNLAPVVDLNTNPQNPVIGRIGRSFSADPEVVTRHSLAFIEAHHQAGVLCTLKHFPGHGSSAQDSHLGFVNVTDSWHESELVPYAQIIGRNRCDAIMTAHIFNGALDVNFPATLSASILTGILRQRMNYDGIIMTDDIQMAAIRSFYDFETAIELAVNAGVDVFASSTYSPAVVERTIQTVQALVEVGKVSEARIDDSYRRVLALKSRLGPADRLASAPKPIAQPVARQPAAPAANSPGSTTQTAREAESPEDLIKYLY